MNTTEQELTDEAGQELSGILNDCKDETLVMMQKMGETLHLLPKNLVFLAKAQEIKDDGIKPYDTSQAGRAIRANARLILMQVLALQTIQYTGSKVLEEWLEIQQGHQLMHRYGINDPESCREIHKATNAIAESLGMGSNANLQIALLISSIMDDEAVFSIINAAVALGEELNVRDNDGN